MNEISTAHERFRICDVWAIRKDVKAIERESSHFGRIGGMILW